MGVMREFQCPSCHETWRVRIGHGMMHGDFDRVLKEFPDDIQKRIKTSLDGEKTPFFRFNYCVAVCLECKRIIVVPVIYLHKTKQTFSPGCPACGSQVTVLEKDSVAICPHCNKEELLAQDIGTWD